MKQISIYLFHEGMEVSKKKELAAAVGSMSMYWLHWQYGMMMGWPWNKKRRFSKQEANEFVYNCLCVTHEMNQ